MLFNSIDFGVFFLIVVIVFYILPGYLKRIWLLIASLYFYMNWNPHYVLLMLFSIITTYTGGLLLNYTKQKNRMGGGKKKKIILGSIFLVNIFILVFFKDFVLLILNINYLLELLHWKPIQDRFRFLLPMGISFYTFQALGYIVDVYRNKIDAEQNFLDYAIFVSFFPQLVAGPIERSGNLLAQIKKIKDMKLPSFRDIQTGGYLILWGLFQKMVIADRIAILVNQVFDQYYLYGSIELMLAALGFSLQIYCDFASYSIIAIGCAKILGIRLMENFNTPYFSKSIKEFWHRWHISLSEWFSDYLYIPLGGNRCSRSRHHFNILIVFLISGLWHGASWTFVIWGAIHGLYQIIGEWGQNIRYNLNKKFLVPINSFSYKLQQTMGTIILVTISWIFFRSTTLADSINYIKRMFFYTNPWALFDGSIYALGLDQLDFHILLFAIGLLLAVDLIRYKEQRMIDVFLIEQCFWFQWLYVVGLVWMIFVFGVYGPDIEMSQFIYFQF